MHENNVVLLSDRTKIHCLYITLNLYNNNLYNYYGNICCQSSILKLNIFFYLMHYYELCCYSDWFTISSAVQMRMLLNPM